MSNFWRIYSKFCSVKPHNEEFRRFYEIAHATDACNFVKPSQLFVMRFNRAEFAIYMSKVWYISGIMIYNSSSDSELRHFGIIIKDLKRLERPQFSQNFCRTWIKHRPNCFSHSHLEWCMITTNEDCVDILMMRM